MNVSPPDNPILHNKNWATSGARLHVLTAICVGLACGFFGLCQWFEETSRLSMAVVLRGARLAPRCWSDSVCSLHSSSQRECDTAAPTCCGTESVNPSERKECDRRTLPRWCNRTVRNWSAMCRACWNASLGWDLGRDKKSLIELRNGTIDWCIATDMWTLSLLQLVWTIGARGVTTPAIKDDTGKRRTSSSRVFVASCFGLHACFFAGCGPATLVVCQQGSRPADAKSNAGERR